MKTLRDFQKSLNEEDLRLFNAMKPENIVTIYIQYLIKKFSNLYLIRLYTSEKISNTSTLLEIMIKRKPINL
jgi:hypothetical protein